MATAKITKKSMSQDEFIEGVFDFGAWLEVHWKRVAVGTGAAVAVVLLGIAWNAARENAAAEANRLLAEGIEAYSPVAGSDGQTPAPRYAEALALFEQAASKGGSQGVGDVARLFRARALMTLSRGSEAIPLLEVLVKSRNEGFAAGAKIALAEAIEVAGDPDRAATLLQEVASVSKGTYYPQEAALLLLGDVRARQGKKDDAKRIYDDLLARFPQSAFTAEARQRTGAPAVPPR